MARLLPPDQAEGYQIVLQIKPEDIDFLTRIIEGYDGLGIVSTIDPGQGLVVVWVTPDTQDEVTHILHFFPRALNY